MIKKLHRIPRKDSPPVSFSEAMKEPRRVKRKIEKCLRCDSFSSLYCKLRSTNCVNSKNKPFFTKREEL